MAELHVTSASNPRLRAVLALRRRRVREQEGRTVVDGYEELALALDAGVVPDTVLHCPELMLDPDRQCGPRRAGPALGASTIRCSRAAFEKVAYREGPDGFLAVVPVAGVALDDLALPADPLVLVCEGLEKPGNLGAVLRTAEAAGVAAVVAADPVTDWGNPNVVRSSKGTVFSVPVGGGEHRGGAGLAAAQRHPAGGDHPRHRDGAHGRRLPGAVAIAVGTEKEGLTDLALDAADGGCASRWWAGSTRSTPPRRPRSWSTRRSASGPGEAGVTPVTTLGHVTSRSRGVDRAVSGAPLARVRR